MNQIHSVNQLEMSGFETTGYENVYWVFTSTGSKFFTYKSLTMENKKTDFHYESRALS